MTPSYQPDLTPQEMAEVFRLLGDLDEFKGSWRKIKEIKAEKLAGLRQIATIESSGSSTRIEGAELSDAEVARVLGGLSLSGFRQRDAAQVLGYGEVLQTIFDNHSDIPLEERFIQQLHGMLLRHSEKEEWHRGHYKTNSNHVEARHPDGRVEIIFHTASPFETRARMEELVTATNHALAGGGDHALIVVARFLVEFLAIHPFQDGNGRLSRALTTLLLLQSGYEYVPYASLERVVEDNKTAYYTALRLSQTAIGQNSAAFGRWLLFFLRSLRTQQENLLAKLDIEKSMVHLSEIQEHILALLDGHGSVTSTLVSTTLEIPVRTVRYHLDVLIRQGMLVARGERRGRTYARATGQATDPSGLETKTAAILGEILERGGRIDAADLTRLVTDHGYDPRVAGTLHGKRLAHLRRDHPGGVSVLTARGREVAEQYLFARRLAWGARGE